ncbi:MAG: hypothetical protein KC656_30045, partial [Myxococcales bacterium]|nr:hypothetical protein [Myxococcales bacterium]
WGWNDLGTDPFPDAEPSHRGCNPRGLLPGTCPPDTTCQLRPGGDQAQVAEGVCVGQGDAFDWTFDLEATPATLPTVSVSLVFTDNGGAWPDGDDGLAGELVLIGRTHARAHRVTLPTDPSGVVAVDLPVDTYDAYFEAKTSYPDGWDTFPYIARSGVLAVLTDGEAPVDVETARLTFELSVDGQVVTALPERFVDTTLAVVNDTTPYIGRFARDPIVGTVVLPPGRYAAEVWTSVRDVRPYLNGTFEQGPVDLAAGDHETVRFDLTTVEVSGTVTLDGAPLTDGTVSFSEGAGFQIGDDGSWSGRAFDVPQDVWVSTVYASSLDTRGKVRVLEDVRPADVSAIEVTTTPLSVAFTVEGRGDLADEPPPRGTLTFRPGDGGWTDVKLPREGPATFEARVFGARGDVDYSLDDSSIVVSRWAVPVAEDVAWTQGMQLHLPVVDAELALVVDGAPADASWSTDPGPRPRDEGASWGDAGLHLVPIADVPPLGEIPS